MTEQNNETPLAQQARAIYDRQGEAAMLDFIEQHRALRRLALPAFSGEARLSDNSVVRVEEDTYNFDPSGPDQGGSPAGNPADNAAGDPQQRESSFQLAHRLPGTFDQDIIMARHCTPNTFLPSTSSAVIWPAFFWTASGAGTQG